MTVHSLHWRVRRIKELVEEREWDEFADAVDAVNSNASTAGGFSAGSGVHIADFRSDVDVDRLFQPFLDMPMPQSLDRFADLVFHARKDVSEGWNEMVTRLAANSANWKGDAGDAFNRYTSRLTGAALEHMQLLEDLETIYRTYRSLIDEAWKAAKQVAHEIIEKLKDIDRQVSFDFDSLVGLALATAGIISLSIEAPPASIALLTQASAIAGFGQAGKAVIEGIHIHGDTVRHVMTSAKKAVEDLERGIKAKGQAIADTLAQVYGLLEDNQDLVRPPAPVLPT
jgi:uncharacterized protein YukE